jgi:hypothetical protein
MDWVNLAQDRDKWWAFANTIMIVLNLRMRGIFEVAVALLRT